MKLLLFFVTAPLWAQFSPVMVYSELAKLDAKAKPVGAAREILSPPVVRNGYTSFQVAVEVDAGKSWELWVAQNPENAVDVTLYRETGETLEKVAQPVMGTGPAVFWLDLHAAVNAEVARIKIEPQLHLDGDWVIYPMEGRVTEMAVPDPAAGGWPGGTSSPEAVMREYLCGVKIPVMNKGIAATPSPDRTVMAALRFRNAQQDVALAGDVVKADLQERFGSCDAVWPANTPERYLRVRDLLIHTK